MQLLKAYLSVAAIYNHFPILQTSLLHFHISLLLSADPKALFFKKYNYYFILLSKTADFKKAIGEKMAFAFATAVQNAPLAWRMYVLLVYFLSLCSSSVPKKAPVKNLLRVSSKSYTQAPTVNEIQPTIVSLLSNTSSKKIFGGRLYDVYILHLRATRESLLCRTRDKKYLLSDKHKQKIIKRQGFLYNQILPISIKYFIRAWSPLVEYFIQ